MVKVHGGDIYSHSGEMLDFSTNINPLGISENIIFALKENIYKIVNYPDVECRKLRKAIAEKENVESGNIICGNGAAEIIFNIVQTLKPKRVLLIAPTFAEYEQAVDTVGAEKVYCYLYEENEYGLCDDILDYICADIDMVFICNPNNPTGKCTENGLIKKIVEKCEICNAFVVLDECFMDFVENSKIYSMTEYAEKYDNIMILKAFTKMYAMPGIRLGYGICKNKAVIEKMYCVRQPWSVSVPAQVAGMAALKETELPRKTIEYIKKEREYLMEGLAKLNIRFFVSNTNYILFKTIKELDRELLQHNIMIRDCSNYKGLTEGYYRIAVKKHDENERLLKIIGFVMGEK